MIQRSQLLRELLPGLNILFHGELHWKCIIMLNYIYGSEHTNAQLIDNVIAIIERSANPPS